MLKMITVFSFFPFAATVIIVCIYFGKLILYISWLWDRNSHKKHYLFDITVMYDGSEFIYGYYAVCLNESENIQEFVSKKIEDDFFQDEDNEPYWSGQWYTDDSGYAYQPGTVKEVSEEDFNVLSKFF